MPSDKPTAGDDTVETPHDDPHAGRLDEEALNSEISEEIDAIMSLVADQNCDIDGCLRDATHRTPTGRQLCAGHWREWRGGQ